MTDTAAPLLTGLPATLPARLGAGHGWERCLVRFLRVGGDDLEENGLLPQRRLAATRKPLVSRGSLATQSGNDLGGGILGKVGGKTHSRRIHAENKSAMRKIDLAQSPQCGQNDPAMKLQSDINDYTLASNFYKAICDQSEASRERAVELREARQGAFQAKRDAAENIIMSVLGEKSAALAAAGLKKFYNELAAGEHSTSILFQIADETSKAFK